MKCANVISGSIYFKKWNLLWLAERRFSSVDVTVPAPHPPIGSRYLPSLIWVVVLSSPRSFDSCSFFLGCGVSSIQRRQRREHDQEKEEVKSDKQLKTTCNWRQMKRTKNMIWNIRKYHHPSLDSVVLDTGVLKFLNCLRNCFSIDDSLHIRTRDEHRAWTCRISALRWQYVHQVCHSLRTVFMWMLRALRSSRWISPWSVLWLTISMMSSGHKSWIHKSKIVRVLRFFPLSDWSLRRRSSESSCSSRQNRGTHKTDYRLPFVTLSIETWKCPSSS